MNEYCFSTNTGEGADGIAYAMRQLLGGKTPVIVCVGTDASVGDSLGPIVGTMLKESNAPCFVYGSLEKTVTAKEVAFVKRFIASAHPYSKVLTIDAAVGRSEDIGFVKVFDDGIKPGLGAKKDLPPIGDVSIIGIVAKSGCRHGELLSLTRLGDVYRYSKIIANGIMTFFREKENLTFFQNHLNVNMPL